jgi:hypothetical protein
MDQAAPKVKAEAEEPQDQNDYKDRPKHIFLSQNVSALGLTSALSAHNASLDEVLIRGDCLRLCAPDCIKKGVSSGRHDNFALQDT